MSDDKRDITDDAARRLAHARMEADSYLSLYPDEAGFHVTIRLTSNEWGYVIDALQKAQSSMKWDARKMAYRFASEGFPFDTEMPELTMMYVESKRWAMFSDHIYEQVLVMTMGNGEFENDDE